MSPILVQSGIRASLSALDSNYIIPNKRLPSSRPSIWPTTSVQKAGGPICPGKKASLSPQRPSFVSKSISKKSTTSATSWPLALTKIHVKTFFRWDIIFFTCSRTTRDRDLDHFSVARLCLGESSIYYFRIVLVILGESPLSRLACPLGPPGICIHTHKIRCSGTQKRSLPDIGPAFSDELILPDWSNP